MLTRILTRLIVALVAIAGIAIVALYLFQDMLIFQSVKLAQGYAFTFDQAFEEHFVPIRTNSSSQAVERINALWFKPTGPSKGLILYFHGNRGNLQRWGAFASDFTIHGFDVLMIDYRGYGKSSGRPTEEALYADAEEVLTWARSRTSFERLILYGRSLGSAVASHLAIKAQPDLLILETPFDDLRGVIQPFWRPLVNLFPVRSVFSNKDHLATVKCKTVVFHGTDDQIVPLQSALRLKPLLGSQDNFVVVPKGRHRNLRTFEEYKMKLAELLNGL